MSKRSSKRERNIGHAYGMNDNYDRNNELTRKDTYLQLLTELALNRFEWRGLPPTIDERWLEMCLFNHGVALFFEDMRIGAFLATQCSYQGRINLYNNPTRFQPVGTNYHYKELAAGVDCVPIWDNRMRWPFKRVLAMYADRLARFDRALDVNLNNQTMPSFVVCDENTRLSVENAMQQRNNGADNIVIFDSMDPSATFQAFPANTPYIIDKLAQDKLQCLNEALSFLGIQSNGSEKRERLISAEVNTSAEKTNVYRAAFLKARQTACDKINRLYDLEVSVEWSNDTTDGIIDMLGAREEETA